MKRTTPLRSRSMLRAVGARGRRLAPGDREWSRIVLARANGTCQLSGLWGIACWGPVDPAHINGKQSTPKQRHDPDNGIGACRGHHRHFDTHWVSCIGDVLHRADQSSSMKQQLKEER